MKQLLLILLLVSIGVAAGAQTQYPLRFDSVTIERIGSNGELILKNGTRSKTGAFLQNRWDGRTQFAYALDSVFWSGDTLVFRRGPELKKFKIGAGGGGGSYTFISPLQLNGSEVTLPGWNGPKWDSTYNWWKSDPLSNYYTSTQINQYFAGSLAMPGYNKAKWDSAYNTSKTALTKEQADTLYASKVGADKWAESVFVTGARYKSIYLRYNDGSVSPVGSFEDLIGDSVSGQHFAYMDTIYKDGNNYKWAKGGNVYTLEGFDSTYLYDLLSLKLNAEDTADKWQPKGDYELVANKSTATTLGTSNIFYPSQNAVKTYVDNAIASSAYTAGWGIKLAARAFEADTAKWRLLTRADHYRILDSTLSKFLINNVNNYLITATGNGLIGESRLQWDGSKFTINSPLQPSASDSVFVVRNASGTATYVRADGSQVWYIYDTNGTLIGTIAVGRPSGRPGVVFGNETGNGRSQIRQYLHSGGLAFEAKTGSVPFTYQQMVLNTDGELIIHTTPAANGDSTVTDAGSYKLQVQGNAYIADTIRARVYAGLDGTPISSTGSTYTLPVASSTTLGGVKVGSGLSIAGDGTLSTTGSAALSFSTSSATTLTLATTTNKYFFNGTSAATWTLPAVTGNSNKELTVKNIGTANLTISRAGSDQIYHTAATNTVVLFPGESFTFSNNGTYWITN